MLVRLFAASVALLGALALPAGAAVLLGEALDWEHFAFALAVIAVVAAGRKMQVRGKT